MERKPIDDLKEMFNSLLPEDTYTLSIDDANYYEGYISSMVHYKLITNKEYLQLMGELADLREG